MSTESVQAHLRSAISIGAPTFNEGRHEDCFRIYKGAAEAAVAASGASPATASRLQRGLADANRQMDPTQRAWTMRQAMDDVLSMPPPSMMPRRMPPAASSGAGARRGYDPARLGFGPARDSYQDMNDRARERVRRRPMPPPMPPPMDSPPPMPPMPPVPMPPTPLPRTPQTSGGGGGSGQHEMTADGMERAAPMPMPETPPRETPPRTAPPTVPRPSRGPSAQSPLKLLDRLERGESAYQRLDPRQKFDRPREASWAPPATGGSFPIGGDRPRDGAWQPPASRQGLRTSHFGAFQSGGPATNKHYTNSLRGASLAFHDTSDKFVTTNDAFFGANARFMPSPPPPRVDPNFRYVDGDRRRGVAQWQRSE